MWSDLFTSRRPRALAVTAGLVALVGSVLPSAHAEYIPAPIVSTTPVLSTGTVGVPVLLSTHAVTLPAVLPVPSTGAVLLSTPTSAAPVMPVPTAANPPALLTLIHPMEGAKLPPLNEVFVYGAVTPGSTLTINGAMINVHSRGGYLAMVPVVPGEMLLHAETRAPNGGTATLDRRFFVSPGFQISPQTPAVIEKYSVVPTDDELLMSGDTLRVFFQGSSGGSAEFSVSGSTRHVAMAEQGLTPPQRRGLYQGFYTIPPGDKANHSAIQVTLRKNHRTVTAKAIGHLTVDSGVVPRTGLVTDDIVAVRTGPEGGYDLFLHKGMRVGLSGKIGNEWRVRLSALQNGWVKDSAIQPLPPGSAAAQSYLTNMVISRRDEDTVVRIPLSEMLPYRVEQSLDPMQLVVTLYGAVDKTDLIKYDSSDPLIRLVRWRQISADTAQIVIQPKFKTWWGFDVRYEGATLVVEVRPPWTSGSLANMVIAVDPGHGHSDLGAQGPHGTFEKDANLQIARVLVETLSKAGAKPFLTRDADIDLPLYERTKIAWDRRARLFVSVHCNASGDGENPIWNNGYSVYWYQPQSIDLATAIHAGYQKHVPLTDHGLFFADLAVCRATQMPAVLTEQAFIIVPEQEQMIFDSKSQQSFANAIVNGIKSFLAKS